ncbi:phage portal protein [Jiangella muralis]|uniref:phage portal protein n=1 Tax=Jiangella muralis TaxID=702383 RepID=UPI00069D6610|nr:phage portal protein [Jiangella muralis]
MRWPWQRRQHSEPTNELISIGDPALAGYFNVAPNFSGVVVGEASALAVSAFYRGVMLIATTFAGLPLKSYTDAPNGQRKQVTSWLDDPGGVPGQTPFAWKETSILHLLLHGDCFLKHVSNQGGALIGSVPIHPQAVTVEWEKDQAGRFTGRKLYKFTSDDGKPRVLSEADMTQVMGPSLDGLRGLSLLGVARNSLGTTIAGDRAAAKMFRDGALIAGLVSPEDDLEDDEYEAVQEGLNARTTGLDNAGRIALVSKKLNFTPWTMSAEDAQFLQSRQFQIQEIARWTGVPASLLMDPGAVSTWGTGVEIQNRGLARFTLSGWTGRFEQQLSRTLSDPMFCEFEYAGLERPTPEQEIDLLIKQVQGGILTANEARRIRNLPPIEGGDDLRTTTPAAVPAPAEPAPQEVTP